MTKLNLSENFISRIWENKSYYSELKTTNDEDVTIVDFGTRNPDAGPDYKNAKVKISGKFFTGSIEIHRSVKDWHLHNHRNDKKYSDLVLHVVFYDNDIKEEFSNPIVKKSRHVPTVVLSKHLTKSIHSIWREVIATPEPDYHIPCYPKNFFVPAEIKKNVLDFQAAERLKFKTEKIDHRISILGDVNKKVIWEKCLFELICEALGYSKNKEQFFNLAYRLDFNELKNLNPPLVDIIDIDSILYGFAGFLSDLRFKDSYILELKSRWGKFRINLRKEIMDKSEWNFFRLRPVNFPTIRIAYASGILFEILRKDFLRKLITCFEESSSVEIDLKKIFKSVPVSEYWKTHNNFGKVSGHHSCIGDERISDITVNVVLPLIYYYALVFKKENLKSSVLRFLNKFKTKLCSNEITRMMERQLNVSAKTLAHQQALIHLYNFGCSKSGCSSCDIGKHVFGKNQESLLKIILY